MLVSKPALFRIGLLASVLLGFFLLGEALLRMGLSERRMREGFTRATGMAVEFEHCSVGIFGGVSLRGLTATNGSGDSFSVQSVFVRPNLWACLRGRIRCEEVRLDQVRFVRIESAAVSDAVRGAGESTASKAQGREAVPREIVRFFDMAKRVLVTDAAVDWMKPNGRMRLQLEGAGLHYEETARGEGIGELHVQRGMLQEMVAVDAVQVRLKFRGKELSLEECTAQCGGGKLVCAGSVGLSDDLRFVAHLSVEEVVFEKMGQELPSLRLSGAVNGKVDLEGHALDQQTWVGGGEMTVVNGMFKGLGVLQMLGQIFQVHELAQLSARKAHSQVRIADKKVLFESLQIDAGDIQLSAPGVIDFKRALSLQAQISLPEQMLRGKALQLFDKRFSPADGAGRRSLAFQVTGTLEKPQTDLLDKLVGDNLGAVVGGALGGVVDQFLGGLLKPRKPAKPEAKEDRPKDLAPNPQAKAQ
jgi:hypothetical protein